MFEVLSRIPALSNRAVRAVATMIASLIAPPAYVRLVVDTIFGPEAEQTSAGE